MKARIILFLIMTSLFVFSGCEELIDENTEPKEEPENQETHEPNISLSETSIDFGEVRISKNSTQSFSISNTGDTFLNVESVNFQDTVFKIIYPDFPQEIDPEDNIVVTIEFHPEEEKSYSDNLIIVSDDPDESEISISLEGIGINPPGTMKWRYAVSGSAPAIGRDGTIYVASDSLYAINPNGMLKWKSNLGGKLAIGEDGTIYVLRGYGLHAVNPDGTEKWKFTTGGISLAIGRDGTIYVASDSLYAINPNGTLKWKSNPGGKLAIASDGTIYASAWQSGYLYAFNKEDGSKKWMFEGGWNWILRENEARFTSPAIDADGIIYVASITDDDRKLYAVNPDGTEKWFKWIGPRLLPAPVIGYNGTIYISTWLSYMYVFNQDGTGKWKSNAQASGSPALGEDGTIYMSSSPRLYALDLDGNEKWNFYPSADLEGGYRSPRISSPVVGEDGTIYLMVNHTESAWPNRVHRYLYAIRGETPLADSPWPMYRHDPQHTGRQD